MGGQVWPEACTREPAAIVNVRWLTSGGSLAALAIGGAVYAGLGAAGMLLLIAFFTTSSLLTAACRRDRVVPDADATGRTAVQVLANGGVAAIGALLALGPLLPGSPFIVVGALAAATADTWATELGMRFGSHPRSVRTLAPVAPGTPGAMSASGTAAGTAGAVFIGLLAAVLLAGRPDGTWLLAGAIGGVAGMVVDTLAGAFLEPAVRRIGNNVVNLMGTAAGGLMGWLVGWLAGAGPSA